MMYLIDLRAQNKSFNSFHAAVTVKEMFNFIL